MTGFAALTANEVRASVGVTIRTVNHRFLDIQLRVPSALAWFESRLRASVQRRVSRGRVELTVSLQQRDAPAPDVELNEEFAARLAEVVERARARGLVEGRLLPGDLLRLPQALVIREPSAVGAADGDVELAAEVEAAVGRALAELDTMRLREGEHLRADLEERGGALAVLTDRIEAAAREGRDALQARLAERVAELVAAPPVDPSAIAQEIVRTAARSDISEEIVRLRAHLAQWKALIEGDEPCGRKLDFLIQEMNREINTIGSKADGISAPELVVEAKAEIEKMREQVQNVE